MSDYTVGDQYECIDDFYMEEESGGERSFTKGKVYTIKEVWDLGETDVELLDDANDEHMMDDEYMKRYFKKIGNKTTNANKAYDHAMGIL